MPTIVNLRQDPFERTPTIRGQTLNDQGGGYMNDFMAREFWRFVQVQQTVGWGRRNRSSIFHLCNKRPLSTFQAVKEKVEQR